MTTLVLGATGQISSIVTHELNRAGVAVRRCSRNPTEVNAVRFDWSDDSTFLPALDAADRIFLMTPEQAGNLAEPGSRFVELAAAAGIEHLVLLSAMGVDNGPDVTGMRAIETTVVRTGISASILRPNTFMQNFSSGPFAGPIAAQDAVIAPVGDAAVSFIDAQDIAHCAIAELGPQPLCGVLELTGPAALTFADAADAISCAAGRSIGFVNIAPDSLRETLAGQAMPPPVVEMILGFYATLASGAHSRTTNTVEELIGRPATTFADFCDHHASAWTSP